MKNMRYKHVRFYKLATGEEFFHGKSSYFKTGLIWARGDALCGRIIRVFPWTKVRSKRPVGKVK